MPTGIPNQKSVNIKNMDPNDWREIQRICKKYGIETAAGVGPRAGHSVSIFPKTLKELRNATHQQK